MYQRCVNPRCTGLYEPDLTDIAFFQTWEQESGSSNLPIPTTSTRSRLGGVPACDRPENTDA
jgi:hypothetical protein